MPRKKIEYCPTCGEIMLFIPNPDVIRFYCPCCPEYWELTDEGLKKEK